jgi:hypothetical protein
LAVGKREPRRGYFFFLAAKAREETRRREERKQTVGKTVDNWQLAKEEVEKLREKDKRLSLRFPQTFRQQSFF